MSIIENQQEKQTGNDVYEIFYDQDKKKADPSLTKDFHVWQCVSLLRSYSTLDLVVNDEGHTMALLNFLGEHFYGQSSSLMQVYYKMRFKMKLSYEQWRKRTTLSGLFYGAIEKTLDEMKALAISNVQKNLELEDGVPVYHSQSSIIKTEEDEDDEIKLQAKNGSALNKQKLEFARQIRDLLLGLEHDEHQDLKLLIRRQIT